MTLRVLREPKLSPMRGLTAYLIDADGNAARMVVHGGRAELLAQTIEYGYKDVDLVRRLREPQYAKQRLAYLVNIEVREKGEGLGSKMMHLMEEHLRARGYRAWFLHALATPGKEKALARFYEAHGFTRMRGHGMFAAIMPAYWKKLS